MLKSDVKESVINSEITNKVNVDVTANVLQCCIKNKIKKLVKRIKLIILFLECLVCMINDKTIIIAGVITKFLKNITQNKEIVIYGDGN